jgi:ubiquinone/menaquinone biosynthesis C-methylase UbiE
MVGASASNTEWQVYAELDYGASHDLLLGLEEWALLKNHLRQYGLDSMSNCVEVGCGGGRLTNALAGEFARVHALDISPNRIEQARKVPNAHKVTFYLVEQPIIPLAANTCDLCISTHVLQHISDISVVEAYFREMFRVLRPGGCILVHVPAIGAHQMTGELIEVARRYGKEFVKHAVLGVTRKLMQLGLRRLPWKIDHYHVFSFVRLKALLTELGFTDVEFRILSWAGGHGYILARKDAVGQEGRRLPSGVTELSPRHGVAVDHASSEPV